MSGHQTGGLFDALRLVSARRDKLRSHFDVEREFTQLEESCVPSYLHSNIVAAGIAWWRLFSCAQILRDIPQNGPILDFGSATGEIFHLLQLEHAYYFIEENQNLVNALKCFIPKARQLSLQQLPKNEFATILALDSLEHNEDFAELLHRLLQSLRPEGCLVLSGPTENAFYQLGRRIAGFDGHYHTTTIYNIEKCLETQARRIRLQIVPFGYCPLFRISVWKKGREAQIGDCGSSDRQL